ncbi:alginate export family protein [Mucilaginibacter sp. UR6-11]|uniref:alginate export family protein n=1 Tax=Mucilaginibacter sp. UR6-11 TaxID=1435644 RepID=UPI001E40E617|nr:alginate export family protein [Mucilaginibacter sp. UR6-11]MCC8427098.1 alginate export family protein [Mucilaginibacter sp. UR6-11]
MYKNVLKKLRLFTTIVILFVCLCFSAKAQLSLTGQLRTRGELRDGYGTLEAIGSKDAAFIAQRTRLTFNYKSSHLIFQTSIQDVRLWGQDASTITPADGSKLAIHEAWAEIILSNKKDTAFKVSPFDYFAVKVGRQELVYDDERLLGASDWLSQARRHDAIVFKLLQKGWQIDLGVAFNQNTDAINYNGTYYTPANVPATVKDSKGNLVNTPAGFIPLINSSGISAKNGSPAFLNPPGSNALNQNYKALQYLYAAKKFGKTKVSGLFLADQFGKYILDSVKNTSGTDVGYVYGKRFNQAGVNTRYTTGLLVNPVFGDKNQWAFNGGYYYQGGHDKDGLKLNAYTYTLALSYKSSRLAYTGGLDVLSGNDAFSTSAENHRFDPLYGSPHKFWGYMDYFYASSGSPLGGLIDPYLKLKYTSANNRLTTELAGHYFSLADNQKDINGAAVGKHLGTELDFTAGYKLNKFTGVDVGLSYMAATASMEYAKNITPLTARLKPVWAFLQINIKPEFLNK